VPFFDSAAQSMNTAVPDAETSFNMGECSRNLGNVLMDDLLSDSYKGRAA
jgi:hypothetical protein